MQNEFRIHEGDDQLDLFPAVKRQNLRRIAATLILLVVIFLMLVGSVAASGLRMIELTGGLICDTKEQLQTQIDRISSRDAAGIFAPEPFVEGCGVIAGTVLAFWEPIGVYENDYGIAFFLLYHIPGLSPQYGFTAWIPKEFLGEEV